MELFSNSTSLYFFSAILQANAAIIAIVGVFGIFKIQPFQSGIETIKFSLSMERGITTGFWDVDPSIISIFNPLNIEEKYKFMNEKVRSSVAREILENWINVEKDILTFKTTLINPILLISIGIVLGAFGLILANTIHNLGAIVEFLVLLIGSLFQCLIVYAALVLMFDALELEVFKDNKLQNWIIRNRNK